MKRLYHWPLDPNGRMVRIVLAEKATTADLVISPPWAPDPEIEKAGPGGIAPLLIDTDGLGRTNVLGAYPICEHLEETIKDTRLLPIDKQLRANARRLWQWCDLHFSDVNKTLLAERVNLAENRRKAPDSTAMRTGAHALRGHLTFLNALCELHPWLAGRHFSLADINAAAHLSAYDYFGDVDWSSIPDLRAWYAKIKSRPSMRSILEDRLEGMRPAPHYADLDF